jgi:hypothetical protein
MKDIAKAPPGGTRKCHSLAASDDQQNRPGSYRPQVENEGAGEPWPRWFGPEFVLDSIDDAGGAS